MIEASCLYAEVGGKEGRYSSSSITSMVHMPCLKSGL